MRLLLFGLALGLVLHLSAQAIVELNPPFASDLDHNVSITYDASLGNAGLLGESLIYAHTGVITDKSTHTSDWKYVIAGWSVNTPKALLIRQGNSNRYTLQIGNIRQFYNVPANEKILQLAFVFRNQAGTKTGKTQSGGDIFVDLGTGQFQAKITSPAVAASLFSPTATVQIEALASDSAWLTLKANDQTVVGPVWSKAISFSQQANQFSAATVQIVLQASKNGVDVFDSTYFSIPPAVQELQPPVNLKDGINYTGANQVTLQLYAPFKDFVYVIGDFNDWQYQHQYFMHKVPGEPRFWLQIDQLDPNFEYGFQYSIGYEKLKVADVYTEKVLDPWNDPWISSATYPNLKPYPTGRTNEIVSTFLINRPTYQWKINDFKRPKAEDLVIYELLVRDFLPSHDFKGLIDSLDYFKRLGVNCIELMPINEFEGNESWGYNPSFYFAVDKYYGHQNTFKAFVDACHENGIAVVLDMVLNHSFGQNPQVRMYFNPSAGQYGQPTAQNPWFNETDKHPFGVGYDYNHESTQTKEFCRRVIEFWIKEYKIDGYRFDLSKGFTQKFSGSNIGAWNAYDQTRVDIWSRIRDEVRTYDTTCYLILEHLGENNEEKVLADLGFLLWGKMTDAYAESVMGFVNSKADLSWGNYKTRSFNRPHLITYAESHDEERIMYTTLQFGNFNSAHNTRNLSTALKRVAAYHALLLPLKGPKMIWQGAELGEQITINTNGRTGNKPFNWTYLQNQDRRQLLEQVSAIARLKRLNAIHSDDYSYNTNTAFKTLVIRHSEMNTVIMANFDIVARSQALTFTKSGVWYDYLSGDSIELLTTVQNISLDPGDFKIYTDVRTSRDVISSAQNITNIEGNAYPVPNKGTFSIFAPFNIDGAKLLDLSGKEHAFTLIKLNNYEYQVQITQPQSGVYVLLGYTGQESYQYRIVVTP